MNQIILTKNNCYIQGVKMTPIGIMVHSTGANNPYISRYVQPDNGLIGPNKYNNHWNQAKPSGLSVCVHGFLGKELSGNVEFYQTLPFDYVGWHSGTGSLGYSKNANNTGYIGFELCEDGLNDEVYFTKVYNKAIEVCVELCKQYSTIKLENIIGHYEGYQKGIASNHGDPQNWFSRFGKSMDTFRADVKTELEKPITPTPEPSQELSTWAEDASGWVKETGISDGTRPKDNVTREEVWTMLYRYNQLKDGE